MNRCALVLMLGRITRHDARNEKREKNELRLHYVLAIDSLPAMLPCLPSVNSTHGDHVLELMLYASLEPCPGAAHSFTAFEKRAVLPHFDFDFYLHHQFTILPFTFTFARVRLVNSVLLLVRTVR